MTIHALAAVSPLALLAHDVEIGPFCVVEAGASIGAGCQLLSHVVVKQGTTLGECNTVHEGAILGGLPQHTRRIDAPGELHIGSHNTIREHVTLHRSMYPDQATVLGNHNLLMAGTHIAHDCRVASHIIMANNTMLAGHVSVEERAYVSGAVGVHQFCRIGTLAMVGGQAHLTQDVPPYVTVDGATTAIVGLNLVGLRRAGFTVEQVRQLKAAYQTIYRSGLAWNDVLTRLRQEFPHGPAARFHEFFSVGQRGFVPERRPAPAIASISIRTATRHGHREAG
ncbi:MAG: acyl-ACP--UDP-N-acetylglucosamine O-acyltransferase [Pirellulales bacterium]